MKRNLLFLIVPLALWLELSPGARAATYTWLHPSMVPNFDWTDPQNWDGHVTPPSSLNTQLVFGNTLMSTSTNNNSGNFILNSLSFTSASPRLVVGGFPLDLRTNSASLAPSIAQGSASNGEINNNLLLNNGDLAVEVNGAGNLTLGGALSGTRGLTMNGSGTLILSGASNYTGQTNVSGGTLQITGSLVNTNINLNSANSAATMNISGNVNTGSGIYFAPGTGATNAPMATVNLSSGSLTATEEDVSNSSAAALNQSGGTNTVAGGLYLGVLASGKGSYSLSGGSLTTGSTILRSDTSSFTQSGGTHSTGMLALTDSFSDAGVKVGYNLDGGTLSANQVAQGGEGTQGSFNFNGGTLKPTGDNNTFLQGLTKANVRNAGAKIDTDGYHITIAQALLHSAIAGDNSTDGGLAKSGLGALTLSGNNTYNGPTMVNSGSLENLGILVSPVTVTNGGILTGAGIFNAITINNGGLATLAGGNLTANGNVVNNGTIRLTHGARLSVANGSTFTNNGLLDIITGAAPTPAPNLGITLDASVVKVGSVSRGTNGPQATLSLAMQGYEGHTYQLQRRDSLGSGPGFADVGNRQMATVDQLLTFTDVTGSNLKGFYRVQVDP